MHANSSTHYHAMVKVPTPSAFRLWNAARLKKTGLLFRCPTWGVDLYNFTSRSTPKLDTPAKGATYGFVCDGNLNVYDKMSNAVFKVSRHQYWTTSGNCTVDATESLNSEEEEEEAHVFIVQKNNFQSLATMGGPIEGRGRLRYIDGCSDSVLLSPPKLGDPCLNLLYFPPNVKQTKHTHPSIRVGAIASGSGFCLLHDGSEPVPLTVGDLFVIPQDLIHSFETKDEDMRVIAFHPDSDCGPTDESHPMINKTVISTSN